MVSIGDLCYSTITVLLVLMVQWLQCYPVLWVLFLYFPHYAIYTLYFIQYGWSPLYVVTYHSSKEVAEILLAAGARVDLQHKVLSSAQLVPFHACCCNVVLGIE